MDFYSGDFQGDSPPSSEAKRTIDSVSLSAADSSSRLLELVRPADFAQDPKLANQSVSLSPLERLFRRKGELRDSHRAYLARLRKSGVNEKNYSQARAKSLSHASSVEEILLAEGIIKEDDYFKLVAEDLKLPYVERIDSNLIMTDVGSPGAVPGKAAQVFSRSANGTMILNLAPDRNSELAIRDLIERSPEQRYRMRITTRAAIRDALERRSAAKLVDLAANALHHQHPDYSAKQTFVPWQSFLSGLLIILLPYALYAATGLTLASAHFLASFIFLFGVYLRMGAIRSTRVVKQTKFYEGNSFPLYTVMVALHREAAVAPQLIKAISKLDWPPECLEVFYLCESDDTDTIAALRKTGLPPSHRILVVPAGLPRTKPKALNYGLSFASGDFVVIYDAEDRPHPGQLKEAHETFRTSPDTLVCLQAPLRVTNAKSTWFSQFFAFEYSTHFQGLLPHLAKENLPLPLGGTSNHFKREILMQCGAWDPYNVTEDADLGIRLARLGYHTGVLKSPTLEDGPETIREWLPQRIRWQKGWMQTALVHSRSVREFIRSAGPRQAVYSTGIVGGLILAPMLYPVGLASFAYSISQHAGGYTMLAVVDLTIFVLGFIVYALLGFACERGIIWRTRIRIILGLPFYWLWISLASWLALVQLVFKPHHWNKTPHRPARDETAP